MDGYIQTLHYDQRNELRPCEFLSVLFREKKSGLPSPTGNRLLHVFDEARSQILEIRLVFYCLPPKHSHGIDGP